MNRLARLRWPQVILAIALAALAAYGLVGLPDDDGDGRPDRVVVNLPAAVITIDNADADTDHDNLLELTETAVDVKDAVESNPDRYDIGGNDLRDDPDAPAGVIEGPLAAQQWPGCKTAFVQSYSSRNGATIRAIALHYTAGANRAGWDDIDGLTAYSANRANQVSWHFSLDREGHCAYNVPLKYKAWTIAGLNPQTANIEVVGTGRDPDYAGHGTARLGRIVRRIARLHDVPLRIGETDGNCNVTRAGIITHWQGGACSGGHHDIRPYELRAVVRAIRAGACGDRCIERRRDCRTVRRWRAQDRPAGKRRRAARSSRGALRDAGWRCHDQRPYLRRTE